VKRGRGRASSLALGFSRGPGTEYSRSRGLSPGEGRHPTPASRGPGQLLWAQGHPVGQED